MKRQVRSWGMLSKGRSLYNIMGGIFHTLYMQIFVSLED